MKQQSVQNVALDVHRQPGGERLKPQEYVGAGPVSGQRSKNGPTRSGVDRVSANWAAGRARCRSRGRNG